MAQYKERRKIYLPTGILVSLYNYYGGDGSGKQILSMYDIEILTSFIEFYFNYTDTNAKDYIYHFYTLPYFYASDKTRASDVEVFKQDRKLMSQYANKIMDSENLANGKLYSIAKALRDQKREIVSKSHLLNTLNELDKSIVLKPNLPRNAFQFYLALDRQNYRVKDLYDTKLFRDGMYKDFSNFFLLKGGVSERNLSDVEKQKSEVELKRFLESYFLSNSYKLLEQNRIDEFGPDVDMFIEIFKTAVKTYNRINLIDSNNKYNSALLSTYSNMVNVEII